MENVSSIRERNLLINLNLLTDVVNQPNDLLALKIMKKHLKEIKINSYESNINNNNSVICITNSHSTNNKERY